MRKTIFLFLLAAALSVFAAHAQAQIIIIASPNMHADSISKSDVHDIFSGASSNLRNGPRARPVLLNACKTHDEFLSAYIGIQDPQFRSAWQSLVFSGKMAMPPSFDTEAEVVDYVTHHIFTVGYIHKSTPHDEVLVLAIK